MFSHHYINHSSLAIGIVNIFAIADPTQESSVATSQIRLNFMPVIHILMAFQLSLPNPKHFEASWACV